MDDRRRCSSPRRDGAAVSGCAVWPDRVWTVNGTIRGRAAGLSWTDEGDPRAGTAQIALGDDGSIRGGYRDENNRRTAFAAIKRPDPGIDCLVAADERHLKRRLDRSAPLGLALTGVGFDASTDELKLEPRNELVPLQRLLVEGRVARRAHLVVLGRASEPAPDELKRCEKRAARLAAHLLQAGAVGGAVDLEVGVVRRSVGHTEPRVEVQLLPN